MAVSTMQAVSIIGLTRDIDNVISVLGESGVFHPDDVSSFYSNNSRIWLQRLINAMTAAR